MEPRAAEREIQDSPVCGEMYKSSYSQANFGLAAKKIHKQKGKSCSYYMKIVFFFSSVIQSLIIAGLVILLVYGQPEPVEEKRLKELDQSVGKLTMENFILRGKEKNLTKVLNVTLTAKLSNDKVLAELRKLANISASAIKNLQSLLNRCEMEKRIPSSRSVCPPTFCPDPNDNNRRLQSMVQQSEEMIKLVKANFTQTVGIMKTELENSNKEKDEFHLQAITLRRDKAFLDAELNLYKKNCKEEFVSSLRGIPSVTNEFLKRIDDLFSKHISFQLTCDKQRIQLENIRENCSSLSRDVENKLQSYLDIVGNQFTRINGENAKYAIDNIRLRQDAEWCSSNRTIMARDNRKALELFQLKCDQDSEKLLLENRKLKGENDLKENLLSVNAKQIKMLSSTIETLNTSLTSCKLPVRSNPFMPNPFASPNLPNIGGTGLSPGLSKPSLPWPGTGSSGSSFPSFPSAGSSSSSRLGSTGSGVTGSLNTALGGTGAGTASGGLGASRTGLGQTGSSSLGGAGPGLTGLGSAGSSPTATGGIGQSGSMAFGGAGLAKPAIGSAGSTAFGGAKTTAGGIESQPLSAAQINLHLKELHRYSLPN